MVERRTIKLPFPPISDGDSVQHQPNNTPKYTPNASLLAGRSAAFHTKSVQAGYWPKVILFPTGAPPGGGSNRSCRDGLHDGA